MPTWPSQNTRSPRASSSRLCQSSGLPSSSPACRRRADRQCPPPRTRAAPGLSNRARGWCGRPRDRACRGSLERHVDEIGAHARRSVRACSAMTIAADLSARNLPSLARLACGVQAQQRQRRRLDVGRRIDIGAERARSRCVGRDDRGGKSLARHVADITVAHELHPGPALALVVTRSASRRTAPRFRESHRSAAPGATAATALRPGGARLVA